MDNRPSRLPIILLTGASGFIGRHFLEEFKKSFYIYALARRSLKDAHLHPHPNIEWIRLDIGEEDAVARVFNNIERKGGADFIIHLAGYYDFVNKDNPEFERTNVSGTHNILKYTHRLNIKRFIFASSIVVTEFRKNNQIITEKSPADAKFPYAESKKKCEALIKEYSQKFPGVIVRFAAIYSDWCEYGPFYVLLSTWLSETWNSRILAGRGKAAIPYLHVRCLNLLLIKIIRKTDKLSRCPVYVASPDGCTSQKELYEIGVRYNCGHPRPPVFFPKWLALFGVTMLDLFGRLIKRRPFEQPWMIGYVDTQMKVDASKTREELNWSTRGRYHIKRRLLFLIENKKSNPYEWNLKNIEALTKKVQVSPNFKIYEVMLRMEEELVRNIHKYLCDPVNQDIYPIYQNLDEEDLYKRLKHIYHMLKVAVRTGDRLDVLTYAHNLAIERFVEGFEFSEVSHAIDYIGCYLVETLASLEELKGMNQRIHDEIMMTIQLVIDEMADIYENVTGEPQDNF